MTSTFAPETRLLEVRRRVVAEQPISRRALARLLGGRTERALGDISAALDQHLIWEGPGQLLARGGKPRTASLLWAEPPTAGGAKLAASELEQARTSAGLSRGELARRLGVTAGLVSRWESGARKVPGWVAERLPAALDAPPPVRVDWPTVIVDAVRAYEAEHGHGPTVPEAARAAKASRSTVRKMVTEGRLATVVGWRPAARGGRRSVRCLTTRPPGPRVDPPTTSRLRELRHQAGWTQEQVARRLGVGLNTVGHWERDRERVPDWMAYSVSQLLYELASIDLVGPRADEVERRLVGHPEGIGVKHMRRIYGWNDRVQPEAEALLVRSGRAHFEVTGAKGGRRQLYPGPSVPLRSPSPAELLERRRRAGLSRVEAAALVGMGSSTLQDWESGRRPAPPRPAARLLEELQRSSTQLRRQAETLLRRPMPPEEFEKALGRRRAELLVEEQAVHTVWEPGPQGRLRQLVAWGPPRPAPIITGADLVRGRKHAGLTKSELARLLGLSGPGVVTRWESRGVSEQYAERVDRLLAEAGPAASPPKDRVMLKPGERFRRNMAAVRAHPGLSSTQLLPYAHGGPAPLRADLARGASEGLLEAVEETYQDSTGRTQKRTVWCPVG